MDLFSKLFSKWDDILGFRKVDDKKYTGC